MKIENVKVISYYHNDMDGISSAAIIKMSYPLATLKKVQYGDDFSNIKEEHKNYDMCFVVDFCFPDEIMYDMLEHHKEHFCWIDHHKTAMEKLPELWLDKNIDGLRSVDKAACELTWEWMNMYGECPLILQHIGDYDTWKFKLPFTNQINEYVNFKVKKPEDFDKYFNLKNNVDVDEALRCGIILSQKKKQQVLNSFEKGIKCKIYDPERGVFNDNCFVCNDQHNISDLGNYICKQGYDIGIVWSIKNGKIIVSLRSIGDLDVSVIAKAWNGGGHLNAAGFVLESFKQFDSLIMKIKGETK